MAKKPSYADRYSTQMYRCNRCQCRRYGQVVHETIGVPGIPIADRESLVVIGVKTRCDKCGSVTRQPYLDD